LAYGKEIKRIKIGIIGKIKRIYLSIIYCGKMLLLLSIQLNYSVTQEYRLEYIMLLNLPIILSGYVQLCHQL